MLVKNSESSDKMSSDAETLMPNKQWPQWLAASCACLGAFCVSLCFGWSSPSIAILQSPSSPFPITNSEASWITSLMQFGSSGGPILAAVLCKYFGPKMCIILSAFPYFVGFFLIVIAESAQMLYASRIISGLAVGLTFTATPLYLAEISENHNRGGLLFLFSINASFGGILISAIAPYVSLSAMAGIMLIFPVLMLTLWFAPESPLFYVRIQKGEKALKSLRMLRRQNDTKALEAELESMKTNTIENIKFTDCLKEFIRDSNLKAFGIVFMTIIAHQLCGSLPVLLNLENIYLSTKMDLPSNIGILLSSVLVFVVSLASIRLPDIWGRKPLLLFSAAGCVISNAMLGAFFVLSENKTEAAYTSVLALLSINTLMISAVIGLQTMPYVLAGEMFSANVREFGICVISVGGALCGFATSKMFQIIEDSFGKSTVFFSLMVITILFGISMYIFIPETKGKSFQEIEDMLKVSKSNSKRHETKALEININNAYTHTE